MEDFKVGETVFVTKDWYENNGFTKGSKLVVAEVVDGGIMASVDGSIYPYHDSRGSLFFGYDMITKVDPVGFTGRIKDLMPLNVGDVVQYNSTFDSFNVTYTMDGKGLFGGVEYLANSYFSGVNENCDKFTLISRAITDNEQEVMLDIPENWTLVTDYQQVNDLGDQLEVLTDSTGSPVAYRKKVVAEPVVTTVDIKGHYDNENKGIYKGEAEIYNQFDCITTITLVDGVPISGRIKF